MNTEYPKFLSKIAKGEDKIEGEAQDSLAKVIAKIIKKDDLEKKVIGLEGDWGSGKSNLIKIIQSKLGEEYHTFIFDAWGSQEDLTRKSFLEQLLNELFNEEFLTNKEEWKSLKNRLLSKTSTTHTQKFPQIKPHWLILSLSFLVLTVLAGTYEYIGKEFDIINSIYFGFWKPILWIYLIPIAIMIWGMNLTRIEYLSERSRNAEKDPIDQDTKWVTIGKLFYWFNGSEIDSEEVQNIIENDPSVKQFREYFKKIEDEIEGGGKLIIVFDNLDRLDNDKIKSLWSSIHTFFAEDNNSFKSWVIVPYDKKKLGEHLKDDGLEGFISKTFSLNFRITPPVVTQWEGFLNDSLDESFGKSIIDKEEHEYLVKLFDVFSSSNSIKPRQIINYVNDIVALYELWREDINQGNLKLRYVALFVLIKDNLANNIHKSILDREYLAKGSIFFENDEDLDTSISMLAFGVKKHLADEVLLARQLESALREGKKEIIESSTKHKAFQNHFFKAHSAIPLKERINGLIEIYDIIKSKLPKFVMETFWENFGKEIMAIENQFQEFNMNHQAILTNCEPRIGKSVLSKLLNEMRENIDIDDKQEKYYFEVLKIEKYINEEDINIDLKSMLTKTEFNAIPYFGYVNKVQKNFKNHKITCSSETIDKWFFDENQNLDIDKVDTHLSELTILKKEYNANKIIDNIILQLKGLSYNQKDKFSKFLRILKGLKSKPLELELSNQFYAQLTSARLQEDNIYVDAYCIAISNFTTAHSQSANFQSSLRSLTDEQIKNISRSIEWYFSYGDLLKLLTTNVTANGFSKLNEIAYDLTTNNYGTQRLNVNWTTKEFDKIVEKVFGNDEKRSKDFIEKISIWHMYFDAEVSTVSDGVFGFLDRNDLKLVELIINKSKEHFNEMSKEDIMISFREKNKNYLILKALVENNHLDKFSNAFYSAYDDFIKGVAMEKEEVPEIGFWDDLIDVMNGNKLRSTYTSVRDIFINERGELRDDELYFLEKGLINFGNLAKKPESATLKIIIPLIESDDNFESVFLSNRKVLIDVINSSKEHKETAVGELQLKYNSEKYGSNDKLEEVAKSLGLKKEKESKDEESLK
ncbi:hypothetical protein B4Q04_09615 [Zobellia sp. OII3]|uniref:P-loop NTPase fold protein n=1 Tax=Zobellia sp. OII3 TaxID=2034520 RepID=UPI000B538B41|nr:P-loop NTPase fold protein [Zobellia sp. OII3]OWW25839.1 hypothetical protein B4Q04_09615 [Zobellia sp. OII3]